MNNVRSEFLSLFKKECLSFGDFTLSSGQKSNYYLNSKKIVFHPIGLNLLAKLFYHELQDVEFTTIGGPETGAIAIGTTVMNEFLLHGKSVNSFFVRRKHKGYGFQTVAEGIVKSGDKVVVVDDVLTTGDSVKTAIRVLEDMKCEIVGVMCICDRLQGAEKNLSAYNYKPLFTIEDLLGK
jgi:orotate phosphoribosyltransferase